MFRLRRLPALLVPIVFLGVAVVTVPTPAAAQQPAERPTPAPEETDPDVTPPQIIIKTQKAPVYPPAALAARFSGTVMLSVTVLRDGSVGKTEIVECSHPNVGFEQAAATAVKKWRFQPAMKLGEPIESTRQFRLSFNHSGVSSKDPYVTAGAVSSSGGTTPPTRTGRSTRSSPGRRKP